MQRKLVVLFCLVLLAFAGLSVRLILINRDNGDSYKKQVLSQQQYSSTTISGEKSWTTRERSWHRVKRYTIWCWISNR